MSVSSFAQAPLDSTELQNSPKNTEVSLPKLIGFTTVAVGGTGALFYSFLRVAWWDKEQTDFFFKDDLSYVLNIDKVAHFYGGYAISSMFADGLLWSNVSPHYAYGSSWAFSTGVQLLIDYKDGYTPGFGFSKYDVLAGSVGAALPWIEYSIWGESQDYVDLKFSYYQNNRTYLDNANVAAALDDYSNQTYYVVYYPWLKSNNYWKKIWGVSAGVSIDEGPWTRGYGRGQWELYLGLDYNLEEMVNAESMSPFWKGFWRYMNHVKLPSPQIKVYPEFEVQMLYPISF